MGDSSFLDDTPSSVHVGEDEKSVQVGAEFDAFALAFEKHHATDPFRLWQDFRSIAAEQLRIAEQKNDDERAINEWDLEVKTWELVEILYAHRTEEIVVSTSSKSYHSNAVKEHSYYENNPKAKESALILNWLRSTAPSPLAVELKGNRWLHTRMALTKARVSHVPIAKTTVTNLDPDAPTRQGKSLAEQDESFEKSLNQLLLSYLRCGDFGSLLRVCRQTGCFWKAVSIQGSLEYRNPDLDPTDDHEPRGTTRKAEWKKACQALAHSAAIDSFERGLYDVLSGGLRAILPLCESWEDFMWAHFSAICENQIYNANVLSARRILEGLAESDDAKVREQALHPLRILQGSLITETVDRLARDFASRLEAARQGVKEDIPTTNVLRVIAHLLLCIRALGIPLAYSDTDTILSAYIDLLSATGRGRSIPLYAAQVDGGMSTEVYAHFLASVDNEEERKIQINLCRRFSLDIPNTLKRVVELIFEETAEHYNTITPFKDYEEEEPPPDEIDRRLVRAISYFSLANSADLVLERIESGRYLYRRFLGAGRLSAASLLLEAHPSDQIVPSDAAETEESIVKSANEYVEFSNLMTALKAAEVWEQTFSRMPSDNRRDAWKVWRGDAERALSESTSLLRTLLQIQFLEDNKDEEVQHLRSIYIPHVIITLHHVLFQARFLSNRFLMDCMDLVNLVADPENDLYGQLKINGRLEEYLLIVRDAAVAMVSTKGETSKFWNV